MLSVQLELQMKLDWVNGLFFSLLGQISAFTRMNPAILSVSATLCFTLSVSVYTHLPLTHTHMRTHTHTHTHSSYTEKIFWPWNSLCSSVWYIGAVCVEHRLQVAKVKDSSKHKVMRESLVFLWKMCLWGCFESRLIHVSWFYHIPLKDILMVSDGSGV